MPVVIQTRNDTYKFETEEHPHKDANPVSMSNLKLAFQDEVDQCYSKGVDQKF
jgi:hypothetical protein